MAPVAIWPLLLAAIASTCSASAGDPGDSATLLQLDATVGHAKEDACECLVWKDVYQKHGLECGKGKELTFAGGYEAKAEYGDTFCTKFYEKLSGNYCAQLHWGQQREEQWCYVSKACTSFDIGMGGNAGPVKWKQCTPGKDKMLGRMPLEEIYNLSVAEMVDFSMFAKMSYPVYKTWGLIWPAVHICAVNPSETGEKCIATREVQAGGQPMIFDSKTGSTPFGMVYGDKAYEIRFTKWFYGNALRHPDRLAIPENVVKATEYECVAGCGQ
uniref:Uncharacterized protein n=1 Tax=Alexandrium catenella TaxID=2925 RepID=A0A7S1WGD2_ALECA|mmetsp:Transcript_59471/g.159276  ORF Transcript_59471/g.159276 Transcript_59471/m.159276 type:complete len:271 (+) Transcript_59471:51-863(+)|eukprot:CAMPEP_0171203022 /NCGR_PEP_ID=MMETSP0790-20130122/25305_1 /TAXON_ID=2925 /ORGANISM="Alexandrium catenella, Strain OF101" /LENGTH=270 /DNA_ID=CAMNT_0011668467 /DNA_START=48 /DNA_END=860 /DNA_ORIENTATION=+